VSFGGRALAAMTRLHPLQALRKTLGIRARGAAARAARQLLKGFARFGVDLVLDVGANVGQFATQIRSEGFGGRIVSFEPLSEAHRRLSAAAKNDPAWVVHPRCAIGDNDGTVEINIAGNSVSSSLLPMTEAHSSAAGGSRYVGREQVPIARLDGIVEGYLATTRAPFLKVDTQGFEWQVLDGAERTLPQLRGVLCELSLVVLYDGQHLWMEVLHRLEAAGLSLWAFQPGFADPRDGRTLQVDAIFFRI
jgi:FkbM family methyltransferase